MASGFVAQVGPGKGQAAVGQELCSCWLWGHLKASSFLMKWIVEGDRSDNRQLEATRATMGTQPCSSSAWEVREGYTEEGRKGLSRLGSDKDKGSAG